MESGKEWNRSFRFINFHFYVYVQDGTILSWKSTSETSFSAVATSLKGHTGPVLSLVVGAKRLYSGSADNTIRVCCFKHYSSLISKNSFVFDVSDCGSFFFFLLKVWDAETLECIQVLSGHSGDVTTVLCWDQYLLSGSLDKKIKVWGETENGKIEEVYQHNVDDVSC